MTHFEKITTRLSPLERNAAVRAYRQGIDPAVQWLRRYFTQEFKVMPSTFDMFARAHAVSVEIARHNHLVYGDRGIMDQRIKLVQTWATSNNEMLIGFQILYHAAAHELEGCRVYQVSEGLADKLQHTHLRGLKTDDIRLPFPSIYIEVPIDSGLRIWNHETKWHRVVGIYLTEDPVGDDNVGRTWRFLIIGEALPTPLFIGTNPIDNDALLFWRFALPEGKPLDDVLGEASKDFQTHMREMQDEWPRIWRFCMNTILYATCGNAEIHEIMENPKARELWRQIQKTPENSRSRRNLVDRLNREDPQARTILGRSIILDRSQGHHEGPGGTTGRVLAVRQRVEGHWKFQVHGAGRTERKKIFVEPYYRGPEDGPGGALVHRLQ